jgi:hypothetical protein
MKPEVPTEPPTRPPITLTDVEEFIQAADPAQLSSITYNACWRIRELMKEVRR